MVVSIIKVKLVVKWKIVIKIVIKWKSKIFVKKLVIVELLFKVKMIEKYLGCFYKVVVSLGYIWDLLKSKMGVDVDNDYELYYILICGKGDVIKGLWKEVKKVKVVYFVFDLDCEGEVIVWYLFYLLGFDFKDKNWVVFNEIIKDMVKNVFKELCLIDMDLVDV